MPRAMILEPVASVEDYLRVVRKIRDEWDQGDRFWKQWFRGQSCESWDLRPQLFRRRGITLDDALDDEEEFRLEFERRGLQLVGDDRFPQKQIGWYF
jgi:hypothetical protein